MEDALAQPPDAAAAGGSPRVPPTWTVMLGALVGLAVGPLLLSVGAFGTVRDLTESSGPFVLWLALIGAQTMLWVLAPWPLLQIARRHWYGEPAPGRTARREVLAAAAALVLLVAAVPAAGAVGRARPSEFLAYGTVKIWVVTGVTLVVALLAAASIWLIRARLERLRAVGPTRESLRVYVELRAELERLLAYLGTVVGLAVLSSAVLRRVLEQQGKAASLQPEAVVLYGIVLSLILALVYLPTYLVAQSVGGAFRDELHPFPEPAQLVEGIERRRQLDDALGLTVSTSASFRAGVAILAPLIGSLTGLLPSLGG